MKNPYLDDDTRERLRNAALTGAGTTAGLAALYTGKHLLDDIKENAQVKKTRGWQNFQDKLKPGDVLFHRRPGKFSAKADLGPFEIPIRESEVMIGTKGDPFYHSSIYQGKGKLIEAEDWKRGVRKNPAQYEFPEELKAYRPKDQSQVPAALDYTKKMIGQKYKGELESTLHGAKHLAGIEEATGGACRMGKGGIVCTELAAEAYPKVFKDRLASPMDMRHSKDMELVARYGHAPATTKREILLSRLLYPLLKNAKWGLLAGAGAYGLSQLGDSNVLGTSKGNVTA